MLPESKQNLVQLFSAREKKIKKRREREELRFLKSDIWFGSLFLAFACFGLLYFCFFFISSSLSLIAFCLIAFDSVLEWGG